VYATATNVLAFLSATNAPILTPEELLQGRLDIDDAEWQQRGSWFSQEMGVVTKRERERALPLDDLLSRGGARQLGPRSAAVGAPLQLSVSEGIASSTEIRSQWQAEEQADDVKVIAGWLGQKYKY
jgi:hypothetical protein